MRLATSSVTPSFIEFDMSAEGYGCLYLPSIAPQTTPSQAVVAVGMATGSDANIISGIGAGKLVLQIWKGHTRSPLLYCPM